MASFSAELRVDGHVFPVLRCRYGVQQSTDVRGRAYAKVRYGQVEVELDVPNSDLLTAWAYNPTKRLAVEIVFLTVTGGSAVETLSMKGAYCVGYQEHFGRDDSTNRAYVCTVTLSDPDGFTLRSGGPETFQQAYQQNPFVAPKAPVPVPPLLPEVVVAAEETLLARLWQGMLRLLTGAPGMTAGLLLLPTNSPNDPGYKPEWDFAKMHLPATDKDRARLTQLETMRETGSLTAGEQAEMLALLAKVKGIFITSVNDLDVEGPLRGSKVPLPGFYYVSLAYTKRSKADLKALRSKFAPVRENFLIQLGSNPAKRAILKKAGLTDDEIDDMAKGVQPDGWQVHHKLPLDDGGDNSFHNLMLIDNDPYHLAITNYQNAATHKMAPGETRTMKWPMFNGDVYP